MPTAATLDDELGRLMTVRQVDQLGSVLLGTLDALFDEPDNELYISAFFAKRFLLQQLNSLQGRTRIARGSVQ